MKTQAFVFSYNRPATLRACLESLVTASDFVPDEITLLDDGSTDPEMKSAAQPLFDYGSKNPDKPKPTIIQFEKNGGFSRSASQALAMARHANPDFVFFIEGDYVFRPGGLDLVIDVLTNTPEGDQCLGIAGYDHPNQRSATYQEHIFPNCMRAQMGEDNVNRAALHRPMMREDSRGCPYAMELVSNTCFSSYLHWRNIQKVAAEFPELNDLLDQAVAPRENPNYPDSGKYKAERTVDDGMLSHALSLCWNRYALKHGIDRNRYAAWLNLRPGVAEHRYWGGTHF